MNQINTKRTYASTTILVVGLLLLAASWLWPTIIGGRNAWTEKDAEELANAGANLHSLASDAANARSNQAHPSGIEEPSNVQGQATGSLLSAGQYKPSSNDAAAAQARLQSKRAQLNAARNRGQTAATIMRWLAIAAIVLGVAVYLSDRQEPSG